MTELILEALPDIEIGKPIDMSRVYLYAVRHKMDRDIKAERTFTSLADKLYFLCELSWEMLSTDQMSLNYRLFPERIRRLFGSVVQEEKDLDHWHFDLMGQTMLIRNADGDYTPAHRSLLEFFVAYKFAAELGVLAEDFTELAREQSWLDKSVEPVDFTWSSYFAPQLDENGDRLWDINSGECCNILQGHTSLARSVVFSPDGATLASGSEDCSVRLWDISSGECCSILQGHTSLVRSVAFSPDGQMLASGSGDCSVRLWDINNGECCNILQRHTSVVNSVAFSPDGQTLASGSGDSLVCLWDINNGECRNVLQGHTSLVRSVAFSPDGVTLASGSGDSSVRLWDINNGECCNILQGHTGWVSSVAFSPNGKMVASCSSDQMIKLWDIKTGKCIKTLRTERPYEGMNITGVIGLTETEKTTLKALGAVEEVKM